MSSKRLVPSAAASVTRHLAQGWWIRSSRVNRSSLSYVVQASCPVGCRLRDSTPCSRLVDSLLAGEPLVAQLCRPSVLSRRLPPPRLDTLLKAGGFAPRG